jgi:hypothetical protein
VSATPPGQGRAARSRSAGSPVPNIPTAACILEYVKTGVFCYAVALIGALLIFASQVVNLGAAH